MTSLTQVRKLSKTLRTIELWKLMVEKVSNMPEFHDRNDFEVNLIRFTKELKIPLKSSDKSTDYSFVSKDCFHFSQKTHSIFALNLWNQMLTTESERENRTIFSYESFKCPTKEHPYLRTRGN